MKVATKRRNIPAILFRGIMSELFSRSRRFFGNNIDGRVEEIVIWPGADSEEQLGDLINRAAWYLGSEKKIIICCSKGLATTMLSKGKPPVPDAQQDLIDAIPSHVSVVDREDFAPHRKQAWLLNNWLAAPRFVATGRAYTIIDPRFYSLEECNNWSSLHYQLLDDEQKQSLRNISLENFKRLREELGEPDSAYVFTTGPSLDRALEFEFNPDSVRIICNSMVRNRVLLDKIKPNILVFADPVFHFGPSKYAHEFRRQAIEVIQDYGCYCIVPEDKLPIMRQHYPRIADRIIGMPVTRDPWNFPGDRQFYVRGTKNIMTLLMVPLASALSRNVYIIGADGRSPKEKYFWKHSKENQFEELMGSVEETHPSFFRDRIYTSYYAEHCRVVEDQIERGEQQGISYFSLTPSEIPALQTRLFSGQPVPRDNKR